MVGWRALAVSLLLTAIGPRSADGAEGKISGLMFGDYYAVVKSDVDLVGARYFVRAFPDTHCRGRSKFLGISFSSEKPSDPTEIRQHQGYRDRFQRHERPTEKILLPLHVWKRQRHEIRCW